MNKNYATVPFKKFYCSQNYNGTYSHYSQSHSTNGIKSYPIDIVDDIYCGCDEMKVLKINGVGTNIVNQIFVCSTSKVYMPNGTYDYITYLITHPNDSDINKNLYVGKTFKRGDLIIHQGTDGGVGSHIDLVIGKGQLSWWVKNSYKEWVLPYSLKPEDGMYLDDSFTKITQANGLSFKKLPTDAYVELPKPVERNENVDQIEIIVEQLNCRVNHATNAASIGFMVKGIYNVLNTFIDDNYTWYELEKDKWIADNGSWLKIYKKKEMTFEENEIIEEDSVVDQEEDIEQSTDDETTIYINNTDKVNPLLEFIKYLVKIIANLINKIKKD